MLSPLYKADSLGQNNVYQLPDYVQSTKNATSLNILGSQAGIFVQQKIQFSQFNEGFQTPQEFQVFAANNCGEQIQQLELFRWKEKSLGFATTLNPTLRPFEILISNYSSKDSQPGPSQLFTENSKDIIFRLIKKESTQCCCQKRPRIEVLYMEDGLNKNFGFIVIPCYYCKLGCLTFDNQNQLKYVIEADPCCTKSNFITFNISTPNGDVVASMNKNVPSYCCPDQNQVFLEYISVVFPKNSLQEDKVLILAATIVIDFMYYPYKYFQIISIFFKLTNHLFLIVLWGLKEFIRLRNQYNLYT